MKYFVDELNVDLSWEDKFYQTPLFYSVRQGLYFTTKFLIDKGADVNHLDKHKQTPLFYAARLFLILKFQGGTFRNFSVIN